MFGYISLDKPELKVKDLQTFQAYYCGLCKAIKRDYGNLPRMMLNYDCTFLYLLLSALQDDKDVQLTQERCPASPIKKKMVATEDAAEYAAAVNVLLGIDQLKDAAKDDKNVLYDSVAALLKRSYQRAARRFPKTARAIRERLDELAQIESKKQPGLDQPADAFARLLGEVMQLAPCGENGRILYELGYNLGRWIYLIDAYDDREKDEKKGQYNPFLLTYVTEEERKESAEFNLTYSMMQAQKAYALLEKKKYKNLLDNILYSGLYKRAKGLLEKEQK